MVIKLKILCFEIKQLHVIFCDWYDLNGTPKILYVNLESQKFSTIIIRIWNAFTKSCLLICVNFFFSRTKQLREFYITMNIHKKGLIIIINVIYLNNDQKGAWPDCLKSRLVITRSLVQEKSIWIIGKLQSSKMRISFWNSFNRSIISFSSQLNHLKPPLF